jgi:hypothetical protein
VSTARRRRKLAKLKLGGTTYSIEAPGLKCISRSGHALPDLYWVADEKAVNAGYPTKTVRIHLHKNGSHDEIIELVKSTCRSEQNAMLAWLDGEKDDRERLAPKFDGTISSLADCYESDADSAYQELRENSANGYQAWLKMVRKTVGARLVHRLVAKDFRRWYRNWKEISTTKGTDGTRQAYGGVQIIRILLSYGAEAGILSCRRLRDDMKGMRFRKNAPRTVTMSFEQVKAFIEKAFEMNLPFMALCQALQFELLFRQIDIRGTWQRIGPRTIIQKTDVVVGVRFWRGITMDMLKLGDQLVVQTSKTGQPVVHAIASCELVVDCLRRIEAIDGPVARQPNGLPWPDHQAYGKEWRKIATAAGIPKNVWNMDSRASGISEASEAGVSDDDITKQAGNSDEVMKRVYKRKGRVASERSHAKRQEFRQQAEEDS